MLVHTLATVNARGFHAPRARQLTKHGSSDGGAAAERARSMPHVITLMITQALSSYAQRVGEALTDTLS